MTPATRTCRTILHLIAMLACIGSLQMVALADSRPDMSETVSAWYKVRGWVDNFTPPPTSDASARTVIGDASACCIILRFRGRMVGVGTAEADDGLMLRTATARALSNSLSNPTIAALPLEIRKTAGRELTVELEVAGPIEPLIGDSFQSLDADIHPLHHGIALRWLEDWSFRFPSRLRLANNHPQASRLDGMALEIGRSPQAAHAAMLRGDATVYRFGVLDLGQVTPDAPPIEISAGTLGAAPAVTSENLRLAHAALLEHILSTAWPGEEELGVMGTYEPEADRYKPLIASPPDQALLAFVLAREASSNSPHAEAAANVARMILGTLAGQETPHEIRTAAAVVLTLEALNDTTVEDRVVTLRRACLEKLNALVEIDASTTMSLPEAHATAMAAWALAQVGETGHARQLADIAWTTLPMERHSTLLPWIAWCELDLAGNGEPAHRDLLLRMRNLLHQRQVPEKDDLFGSELTGGFVLGRLPRDVTAQSFRPGAALPKMLQSSNLTATEASMEEIARLQRLAQFLLQLQVSSEGSSLHRQPGRSRGGIRIAPWDSRMPPAAQAMALLTLQELLSVESLHSSLLEENPELY